MKLNEYIGKLVEAEREKLGISFKALAERMEMNQPTLYRICKNGSKEPRESSLDDVARYFKTTADDLRRSARAASPDHVAENLPQVDSHASAKERARYVCTSVMATLLAAGFDKNALGGKQEIVARLLGMEGGSEENHSDPVEPVASDKNDKGENGERQIGGNGIAWQDLSAKTNKEAPDGKSGAGE